MPSSAVTASQTETQAARLLGESEYTAARAALAAASTPAEIITAQRNLTITRGILVSLERAAGKMGAVT